MSTDQNPALAELQNLSVEEIEERVATLDADELAQLRQLEADAPKPRKGALAAIDAAIAAQAKPEGEGEGEGDTAADKHPPAPRKATPAAPAATADWMRPDYNGPLDIPQSEWRRANLKPVTGVRTK